METMRQVVMRRLNNVVEILWDVSKHGAHALDAFVVAAVTLT